jgi:Ca2+-binding RTX toxin-like protein
LPIAFPLPGETIQIPPPGQNPLIPLPSQGPPPPVEFTAYLSTNMDVLLLHNLAAGFMNVLKDDTIVVDFGAGNAIRLFGDFVYSSPIDLPTGGELNRYQETYGGQVAFDAKYLDVPILDVLSPTGKTTDAVLSEMFAGDDGFSGSNFDDLLRGFGGNDEIRGLGGYDALFGGAGDDTINGGEGQSYLRGDEGNDLLIGGAGFDDMNGNMGSDTLYGGEGTDWVVGGKDGDRLYGEGGDDLILGNLGWDSLSGGTGNDTVRGGQDNDVLEGGDGNDWLSGDRGLDVIYGGRGADTFHFFPGADVDRIMDFNAGEGDHVQLQLGTVYTVEQVGPDVLLRTGQFDQLVLVNVQLSSLRAGWLIEA